MESEGEEALRAEAGDGFIDAAVRGLAGFADGFLPDALSDCGAKDSLSLRTTGASTVEDADLTNSPMSLSFSRTVLLSTPRSLASSYTRCFATQCSPYSVAARS
jgi:hypothetical protein